MTGSIISFRGNHSLGNGTRIFLGQFSYPTNYASETGAFCILYHIKLLRLV